MLQRRSLLALIGLAPAAAAMPAAAKPLRGPAVPIDYLEEMPIFRARERSAVVIQVTAMPHYIDNAVPFARWISVVDVDTGEVIEHVVAANQLQGWIVVETGAIVGLPGEEAFETVLQQRGVRFELRPDAPEAAKAFFAR